MQRPAILLSSLLLPLSALALGPDPVAPTQEEGEESHVLHESMETLNDGLRNLRGALIQEDVEQVLAILDEVEAAVVEGKSQVPETVEAVAEDQREAFVRDFRGEQLVLLQRLLELEGMVLAGDLAEGEEFLKTEIYAMKRSAHSRFKQEGGWTPN